MRVLARPAVEGISKGFAMLKADPLDSDEKRMCEVAGAAYLAERDAAFNGTTLVLMAIAAVGVPRMVQIGARLYKEREAKQQAARSGGLVHVESRPAPAPQGPLTPDITSRGSA